MAPRVQCGHSALPKGRVLGAGADCCLGEGPLEVVGLCLGAVLTHMRFLRSHRAQALALQRRFQFTLCTVCSPRGLAAFCQDEVSAVLSLSPLPCSPHLSAGCAQLNSWE